jgi:hypothetical protein
MVVTYIHILALLVHPAVLVCLYVRFYTLLTHLKSIWETFRTSLEKAPPDDFIVQLELKTILQELMDIYDLPLKFYRKSYE